MRILYNNPQYMLIKRYIMGQFIFRTFCILLKQYIYIYIYYSNDVYIIRMMYILLEQCIYYNS